MKLCAIQLHAQKLSPHLPSSLSSQAQEFANNHLFVWFLQMVTKSTILQSEILIITPRNPETSGASPNISLLPAFWYYLL